MKKTVIGITGAAFLGAATLAPTPASAFAPIFFVPVLMSKENKNFKAVNPYAPTKVAKKGKKKKK